MTPGAGVHTRWLSTIPHSPQGRWEPEEGEREEASPCPGGQNPEISPVRPSPHTSVRGQSHGSIPGPFTSVTYTPSSCLLHKNKTNHVWITFIFIFLL